MGMGRHGGVSKVFCVNSWNLSQTLWYCCHVFLARDCCRMPLTSAMSCPAAGVGGWSPGMGWHPAGGA